MTEAEQRAEQIRRIPYGYKKSSEGKESYLKDETAAETVVRIFRMAADGQSHARIAEKLNKDGVISPQKYRLVVSGATPDELTAYEKSIWTPMAVRRIVRNPVYLGHLPAPRDARENSDSVNVTLDDLIRVRDNHEAIVPLPLYEAANASRGSRLSCTTEGIENIYAGVAFCSSCGSPLVVRIESLPETDEGIPILQCRRKRMIKNRCKCPAEIPLSSLNDIICSELNEILGELKAEAQLLEDSLRAGREDPSLKQRKRLDEIVNRLEMISSVSLHIYEDMESGVLHRYSGQRMIKHYNEEIESLLTEQEEITSSRGCDLPGPENKKARDPLTEIGRVEQLTAELVSSFIKRIEIGPKEGSGDAKGGSKGFAFYDQAIDISYSFSDSPNAQAVLIPPVQ